jgi:hypothetical protein
MRYQAGDIITIEDMLPGFELRLDELFSTLQVRRPADGRRS